MDEAVVRVELGGRGETGLVKRASRSASACRFAGRLRQCMTFVNKVCQSHDEKDAISARLLKFLGYI